MNEGSKNKRKGWLRPQWESNLTIQNIPISYLINQQIKVLLLDVDNTLLPRNELILCASVRTWLLEAKKHLKLHLISNNPSRSRIKNIAQQLQVNFTCRAAKPRKSKVLEVIEKFDCKRSNIAIIGDRIFTDIWAGNRLGLYTILVKPIKFDGTSFKENYYQEAEKYLSKLLGAGRK